MKNITRGLLLGSLCLGLLAGCSKSELTGALSGTMDSVGISTSANLMSKGLASAQKGDASAATGYFSSWYALQDDKAAARRELQNLAKIHANDAAGKIINNAINKL